MTLTSLAFAIPGQTTTFFWNATPNGTHGKRNPEPATMVLTGGAMLLFGTALRRKRARSNQLLQ